MLTNPVPETTYVFDNTNAYFYLAAGNHRCGTVVTSDDVADAMRHRVSVAVRGLTLRCPVIAQLAAGRGLSTAPPLFSA